MAQRHMLDNLVALCAELREHGKGSTAIGNSAKRPRLRRHIEYAACISGLWFETTLGGAYLASLRALSSSNHSVRDWSSSGW